MLLGQPGTSTPHVQAIREPGQHSRLRAELHVLLLLLPLQTACSKPQLGHGPKDRSAAATNCKPDIYRQSP